MDSSKSNIYIQKKEDGSTLLSFYTMFGPVKSIDLTVPNDDEPIVKRISIVFPKRTTKDELLTALQEGGMVLTKGVRYYTKAMLIEIYGYRSKSLLHQIYLKSF